MFDFVLESISENENRLADNIYPQKKLFCPQNNTFWLKGNPGGESGGQS